MRTIPISSIIIPPDRQRKVFDAEALTRDASSIKESGLLNAIVLRPDECTLVAGERRLQMLSRLIYPFGVAITYDGQPVPLGHVPFTVLAEYDDPLAVEKAEYYENARREPLTWQEDADAQSRLHSILTREAARDGREQTVLDTVRVVLQEPDKPAGQLGGPAQAIREKLILAQHLDNPIIANAKTAKEAFKLLIRAEEDAKFAENARLVGETYSADVHHLFQTNCCTQMGLWLLEGGPKFDCILTDPPYGMGADQFGDGAGKMSGIEHTYEDSYEAWVKLMTDWPELAFASCRPQAHAYVFCDLDRFHELKWRMEAAGWYVFRTPLIYHKRDSGRVPLPNEGPRRQYELVLFANKGHKPVLEIRPDVFSASADEQIGHGAQKPVAAFQELLERSCRAGDKVLDSFAGTGPIFPAAHNLRLSAWGIEQDEISYGKSLARIELLKQQGELILTPTV